MEQIWSKGEELIMSQQASLLDFQLLSSGSSVEKSLQHADPGQQLVAEAFAEDPTWKSSTILLVFLD